MEFAAVADATPMELFSDEWMKGFMALWNADPVMAKMAEINFSAVICYGFEGDAKPSGILVVEKGLGVRAGKYDGEKDVTWDIRATKKRWLKWLEAGVSMSKIAKMYVLRHIRFLTGDYMSMISNPKMATPFVHSFKVMGQVGKAGDAQSPAADAVDSDEEADAAAPAEVTTPAADAATEVAK